MDCSRFETRWRRDFTHPSRPALVPTPAPVQIGTEFLSRVYSDRGVILTMPPSLASRFKIGRAITLYATTVMLQGNIYL